MKLPVIGVTPLFDVPRNSVWMIPGYLGGIEEAGGCPLIIPYTDDEAILRRAYEMCDGILFTGGPDVQPSIYKAERSPLCGVPDVVRDTLEIFLFEWCLKDDKPALGICRGIQLFNAVLGGTLFQDLPSERPSEVEHSMTPPYDRGVHRVGFLDGSPLRDIYGTGAAYVNSYHHQAIKTLSPKLTVSAISEDGLAEGAYISGARFIHSVQWHPELDYKVNPHSRALFAAFVNSAKQT